MSEKEEYVSLEKALKELRLKEEELKRLVSEGEIRAFRDADKMKFRREDIEKLKQDTGKTIQYQDESSDTLTDDRKIVFDEIPEFTPECFAYLHNPHTGNAKKFNLGLEQLLREGVARRYEPIGSTQKIALLAAVGPLQFEVMVYRLENEYGAESRVENANWTISRWWRFKTPEGQEPGPAPTRDTLEEEQYPETHDGSRLAWDDRGRAIVLFTEQFPLRFFTSRNPNVELSPVPFDRVKPSEAKA